MLSILTSGSITKVNQMKTFLENAICLFKTLHRLLQICVTNMYQDYKAATTKDNDGPVVHLYFRNYKL